MKTTINMKTKEIYQYGTKPENPVRVIGFAQDKRPTVSELDIASLKRDLQFYKDEVATLERELNDMEVYTHDLEDEIEDLENDKEELERRVDELECDLHDLKKG